MVQRASPSPSDTMRVKRMESSLGFHQFNRAKSWDSTLKLWREYMLILSSHPLTYISFILLLFFCIHYCKMWPGISMPQQWANIDWARYPRLAIRIYINIWKECAIIYEDVIFCLFLSIFFIHLYEWYINLLSWRAITIIVHPVLDYGITHSVHGSPDSTKGLSH